MDNSKAPAALRAWLAFLAALLASSGALAEVRPAAVFSDHMIFQRNQPIRVWGEGDAGAKLTVTIGRHTQQAEVDAEGKWRVELPAMRVDRKSHTLRIKSGDTTLEFKDIQIGEVWFVAGQSNVTAGMGRPGDTVESLRLMSIDHNDVYGWHVATPDNVQNMPGKDGNKRWRSVSFVAYHFGRHLHQKLGIPVGVMHADHGGSIIAAWMTDTVKTDWPEMPGGKPITAKDNLAFLPGNLYRYKVKKAAPMNIGGVVWWQGESDGKNAIYAKDLKSMVTTWRELFEQPEMPFIAIQIAPNTFSGGPLLVWEAQQWATQNIDHFYLAPNQDAWVGHSNGVDQTTGWPISGGNPHPPSKDQAARRAANIALQLVGKNVGHEVFGPTYASHEVKGDKIIVTLKNVGKGLKSRDGQPLTWFEISDGTPAGNDLKFVKADAKIVGKDKVEVSTEGVSAPKHVRYGWSVITMTNLVNSADLPAITFRSNRPKQ